ncbi:ATP-dependent RNA helicase DHX29 isoform X1 [Acipenser oxyrinchus oxyrinchus]|uniref:ATP-dependent RNA helicase DHX29 n=1 Tax=Acipenser oxyrinchus oxyrinchus TaxID=40147 RepID=A0AAD8LUK5_ACIOX|nr:ATP-dependent RNA helicase DHX29 isoform X1 [Acipenser oxyrinchus oxyrinchus]
MGGKKKKSEAHPAASPAAPAPAPAAAAATATASVGSSDAAASGTTASLNKKKNPRQPSAKSAAKEIKAKGPKTYSFTNAPPTDPGTASNLDKSILKVVIQSNLEQRIIHVINDYKKQHGDKGSISGRLTAKKLLDLYMALQGFSFKPEHIEDAMKNTVLYGGDLHSALDWLCLNLRDDELPEGFSQKMQTEEQITRSQFQPPPEKKELSHSETKRVDEKPEAKQASVKEEKVNMKEWILRYAEQESEEEDGEESGESKKSSEQEERFDPNDRYLRLTAQLLDAKDLAVSSKQKKDKLGQRTAQDRIRIIQQEMKPLEAHPMFNPALKYTESPKEAKKPVAPPVDNGALNFDLFEKAAVPPEEKVNKEEPKDIRNFDYAARSWTGKTPKQFLIDWCRKNLPKSPQPSFEKVPAGRHWRCRVRVNKLEDGILEVCPTILTEDSMQAQHVAATLALYTLVKGQSVHQLLPPTYREVWLEWKDNEKKKEEQTKIETNKPRDQFITKLLNKLKQQQQQQQQQQKQQLSQGASEAADEPGESWEDLITDEDFSKISIHHEKPDDLESSRALFRKLQSSALFQRLLRDREQLPVFQHRDTVLEAIRRNRVVVVAGETGSGKSTQVPQFILEELLTGSLGSQKCRIVCTQPRRISAMSLAVRVSEELGCEEGPGTRNSLCGYQIRMETKAGDSTRLLYCTTGVLLRKLQQDGLLDRVSHVIVDEVHERSVQSDFLLIILKEILRKRSDLHLILMSATVDCDKFSNYFDRCPVVRIPGRTFPVEVYNLEDVVEETGYVLEQDSDYSQKFLEEEEEINVNVTGKGGKTQIHQEFIVKDTGPVWDLGSDLQNYSSRTGHAVQYMNPHKINMDLILDLLDFLDKSPQYRAVDGAVLVFLPGLAHIQQLYDLLSTDKRFRVKDRYKLIALHSTLSSKDQAAAFTVPPPGVRKIVLATNIAETGVTIPDVVFVIDTGKTKENRYRESSQMSSLVETFISKASALQRQGRAGRVREGVCFRLFTKERYRSFSDYSDPEILRVPLEELCLHIMKCEYGSPEDFLSRALDPPQPQVVSNAMNLLRRIGACEMDLPKLTPLGQHLAALPVNVKIGKMLVFGAIFSCLEPIAIIAAAISEKSPFATPMNRKDEANLAKAALALSNSDHLTIYNAYKGWRNARSEGSRAEMAYCRKYFLNRTALLTIEDVKQELMKMVEVVGFSSPRSKPGKSRDQPADWLKEQQSPKEISLLKAVLTAGLYDNIGKVIYTPSVDVTEKAACTVETAQGKAQVHPSSVNRVLQTYGWLLYQEKVKYAKVYVRDTTLISPFPILLFGWDIDVQHRERLLSVDSWIQFQAPVRIGVIFKQLRALIDTVLQQKLENPQMSLEDNKTIQIITELIKSENVL